jgi:hypothetical protein
MQRTRGSLGFSKAMRTIYCASRRAATTLQCVPISQKNDFILRGPLSHFSKLLKTEKYLLILDLLSSKALALCCSFNSFFKRFKMTKESKARMIAHLEDKLRWLDALIDLNEDNPDAVESLLNEYRLQAKALAELRDEPTND